MKKKLLSVFLALCLCLTLLPATAGAAEPTITDGLTINTFDAVQSWTTLGDGTVTFTPASGSTPATLTLDNATIGASSSEPHFAVFLTGLNNDLIIELKGTSTLTGGLKLSTATTTNTVEIRSGDSGGTPVLNVTRSSASNSALSTSGPLTVSGNVAVNVNSTRSAIAVGDLTIKDGATVTATTTGDDSYGALSPSVDGSTVTVDGSTLNLSGGTSPLSSAFTVQNGGKVTVAPGTTLQFENHNFIGPPATTTQGALTVNNSATFVNNGTVSFTATGSLTNSSGATFVNNGTLSFTDANAPASVADLNLSNTGTGYVTSSGNNYSNSGTQLGASGNLNLTTAPAPGAGYTWDDTNKILTLTNAFVDSITLPTADTKIIIQGTVIVNSIGSITHDHPLTIQGSNPHSLTVKDSLQLGAAALTLQDLTANINSISCGTNTNDLTLTNANIITKNINWSHNGSGTTNSGLSLTNSTLTVNGDLSESRGIVAGQIKINNETSTINLNGGFISTNDASNFQLSGFEVLSYCPRSGSYSIGADPSGSGSPTLYLLKNGAIVTNITLLKNPPAPAPAPSRPSYSTITASTGANGTISPDGSLRVRDGSDKEFTFTPDAGYVVSRVLVDGKDIGAVSSYTFENVRKNHTIAVYFSVSGLNGTAHTAYLQGYPDGTFKPTNHITRAEAATMLYRLLTDDLRAQIETDACTFTDVSDTAWYRTAVSTMANGGFITGFPDGTFRGSESITRAEFITILVRFLGVQEAECSFTDIPESHWAYPYIATASGVGWVTGDTDNTFRPDEAITRGEAIAIINRVLNRGVDADSELLSFRNPPDNAPDAWYYYEIIEAANGHDYTGERPSETWTALHDQAPL